MSDSCNGVAGVPVTFTVTRGNGLVNGQSSVTVDSILSGHAEASFTFGSEPGNSWIEATTPTEEDLSRMTGRSRTYFPGFVEADR